VDPRLPWAIGVVRAAGDGRQQRHLAVLGDRHLVVDHLEVDRDLHAG